MKKLSEKEIYQSKVQKNQLPSDESLFICSFCCMLWHLILVLICGALWVAFFTHEKCNINKVWSLRYSNYSICTLLLSISTIKWVKHGQFYGPSSQERPQRTVINMGCVWREPEQTFSHRAQNYSAFSVLPPPTSPETFQGGSQDSFLNTNITYSHHFAAH